MGEQCGYVAEMYLNMYEIPTNTISMCSEYLRIYIGIECAQWIDAEGVFLRTIYCNITPRANIFHSASFTLETQCRGVAVVAVV